MTQAYVLNTPDVMAEDFDSDLVLLNLRSGAYFNITDAPRAFLDTLIEGISPTALAQQLSAINAEAGAAAAGFFENLKKHGLVRPTPESVALPATPAHAEAILAAGADFPFECFNDLADLLAADPIHDVAPEAGWPVMPDPT